MDHFLPILAPVECGSAGQDGTAQLNPGFPGVIPESYAQYVLRRIAGR